MEFTVISKMIFIGFFINNLNKTALNLYVLIGQLLGMFSQALSLSSRIPRWPAGKGSSCVYNCDDQSHLCIFLHSSNIYDLSYIHVHSSQSMGIL